VKNEKKKKKKTKKNPNKKKLFCKTTTDVNKHDSLYKTSLHWAASAGHLTTGKTQKNMFIYKY